MHRIVPTAAAVAALALVLSACSGEIGGDSAAGNDTTLTIGFVSTETGALAPFGEANSFVVDQMTDWFGEHPLEVDGKDYDVKIVVRDAQSDSKRAGEVAAELINSDNVDVVIASSTPDITNPVSEQCEANSIPCITTVAPWQPFAIRSGDKPADLQWSHHFFWGLEDVAAVYSDIWSQVPNNGKAGGLFPNDPDGQAWSANFPALTKDSGVTIDNPGLYTNGTKDFSAQISKFRGDDILVGVPIPPDFTTFWKQAAQQGFEPKVATIGKALLFPSAVEALGPIAQNLATEVWWTPTAPYTSSLTGQTAQELADAFEQKTGEQWTQPLGFSHALFEVTAAAVQKAGSTDPEAVDKALDTLEVSTVVGDLAWGADDSVPPYVAKTPLTGGQWRDRRRRPPLRPRGGLQQAGHRRAEGRRRGAVAMTSPLLQVEHLAKRFGRVVIAGDVNFEVAAGQVLGVVGPNGAGKSTMLDLVNGTQRPDAGTIRLDGADITRWDAARRGAEGIGRTYQIPRPFGDLSVFENVLVGASYAGGHRGRAAQAAALDALELAGLADLSNQRAGGLRLLDRKRLELARALATGPRLVLLDEIAGGLTERELPALVQTIADLRAAGLGVVWIEHIVHALLSVADRLMCLAAGDVVAIGDPHEVMRSPEVIAVYLGSIPEDEGAA